jgi:nucleoside-diphosphate-sugar epimerase
MKILVTGATGFIGSHLLKDLSSDGHELSVIHREQSNLGKLEALVKPDHRICYQGDLKSLVEGLTRIKPDVVVHLASLFIAEHKPEDVTPLIESNLLFPSHLLEAMSLTGCKRLVNTGTTWQHFENQAYNPVSLYAATKQAFEDLCRFYVEARELRVIHLQLTDSYGPEDQRKKLVATLKAMAGTEKSLAMSPGEQPFDIVHVRDVVSAFKSAITLTEKVQSQETYTVSSGEAMALKSFVTLFEKVLGKKINIDWGARPYRQREMKKLWDQGKWLPGWQPKIPLEQGLKDLIHG